MSSHVVTLRNAILEARAALTGAPALTALVPERSITFGNSPQKDLMPRIVIEVSGAEYDATFTQSRKVQTFTVEYAVYSKSVDTCTAIMDEVRQALDTYQSSDFAVRVTDESFQAEVDNVLLGVVVATFQDAAGIPGFDASAAETLIAVQEDLAAAQSDLAQAQADAAAAQESEAALQAQLDAINTPPAFNATGQVGEDATALWSLRRIAEGYTGPILQIADANTVNGTDDGWTDVRDINESEFKNYYILDYGDTNSPSAEDGREWIVTRIYDQIGSNDLVWEAEEAKTVTGSWPQFGPRLQFHSGAWSVNSARNPYGFATANELRFDRFTAVADTHTGDGARHLIFGAADTPLNAPYAYWAMSTWNSTSQSTAMWVGNGAGSSGTDYVNVVDPTATEVHVNGGRRAMAISRKPLEANYYDGAGGSTTSIAVSKDPAALSTTKAGWATDNYNHTGSSDDAFFGAVYMEGVYKTEAETKALLLDFSNNRVQYRTLGEATNG